MNASTPLTSWGGRLRRRAALRSALHILGAAGLVVGVALSAMITKDARSRAELEPLAAIEVRSGGAGGRLEAVAQPSGDGAVMARVPELVVNDPLVPDGEDETGQADDHDAVSTTEEAEGPYYPPETRWFNGRPVRPARTMTMIVTAYTPDEISCGESADGITSSNHSVYTNAMRLVAADSRVLPLGSMVSVPGYADASIVPVLDRGGKIKGNRLDVLFADNKTARKWGKKTLSVTVWEYADEKPADNWRAIRDSRLK